jgi:hypothetical protein
VSSPLSLSFSPSPPLPSFPRARSLRVLAALRARAQAAPRPGGPARLAPWRLPAAPRPWPAVAVPGGPARPCPSGPTPRRPRVPVSRAPARPRPGGPAPQQALPHVPVWPRVPPARAACSRAGDYSCVAFDFQLNPFFNFSLVDVLCRTLRRATIYFKFIFINDLCRVLRRTTFRLKFKSVDISHRVFRRATLNVSL